MSSRTIYLRDQAAKCEWHADNIRDVETQAALRKLAADCVAEAEDIESKELASRIAANERGRQLRRPLGRDEAGLVAPSTATSPRAGDSLGVGRIVHYAACCVGSVPDDSRPASYCGGFSSVEKTYR